MKKRIYVICLAILCLFCLAGCECTHKWVEATCNEPKTCSRCKLTEGVANGHSWVDATCQAPRTCAVCGLTEGSISEHEWKAATCQSPKKCSVCGEETGEKAKHVYKKQIHTKEYLRSEATLDHPAVYYYGCIYCKIMGTKTYTYGNALESMWVQSYYVDSKFGESTDEWYIHPREKQSGTFSNTATTNSDLLTQVLYDRDGDITIFLYEYADTDNLVKNGSSRYYDYYSITIKNDQQKTVDVRGRITPGGDRIFITSEYESTVLNMMKTSRSMKFYIQSEDSPATVYRFDLDLTDFMYIYNKATK